MFSTEYATEVTELNIKRVQIRALVSGNFLNLTNSEVVKENRIKNWDEWKIIKWKYFKVSDLYHSRLSYTDAVLHSADDITMNH